MTASHDDASSETLQLLQCARCDIKGLYGRAILNTAKGPGPGEIIINLSSNESKMSKTVLDIIRFR